MPVDDAGCLGRPWLAAADVPRQMFIDRRVDHCASSWGWVIDQWQVDYSVTFDLQFLLLVMTDLLSQSLCLKKPSDSEAVPEGECHRAE